MLFFFSSAKSNFYLTSQTTCRYDIFCVLHLLNVGSAHLLYLLLTFFILSQQFSLNNFFLQQKFFFFVCSPFNKKKYIKPSLWRDDIIIIFFFIRLLLRCVVWRCLSTRFFQHLQRKSVKVTNEVYRKAKKDQS